MVYWCSDINREKLKYSKKNLSQGHNVDHKYHIPGCFIPLQSLWPTWISQKGYRLWRLPSLTVLWRREVGRKKNPKGVSETTGWRCERNESSGPPCAFSTVVIIPCAFSSVIWSYLVPSAQLCDHTLCLQLSYMIIPCAFSTIMWSYLVLSTQLCDHTLCFQHSYVIIPFNFVILLNSQSVANCSWSKYAGWTAFTAV